MNETIDITRPFVVERRQRGRKYLRKPQPCPDLPAGSIPRVARLMALAIRFESLLREGVVADQAELARLGHVSRARLTQIMNLLNLAPDIQEAVLFLPRVQRGRDPLTERDLRDIALELSWKKQRRMWKRLSRLADAGQ
ncbi:hypothetical protein [Maioricimonas sp. JC845]|uniref:hypothetical protein n=1 Tax=Maioricimonas sp. JC845 TaxID=3232138 RepID=UPI003457B7F9